MPIKLNEIIKATEEAKGKMFQFRQSVITEKYEQRKTQLHPGGICLALCVFFLSKKQGMLFNDLVTGVYFKKMEEFETLENEPVFRGQVLEIMQTQALIKKGESGLEMRTIEETFVPYTSWMKELGLKYDLRYSDAYNGVGYKPGEIAAKIIANVGKGIVIGIGGVGNGHAVAARADIKNVAFFDPNVGSFYIPTDGFIEWFLEFMYDTDYQVDYPHTFTIVFFN